MKSAWTLAVLALGIAGTAWAGSSAGNGTNLHGAYYYQAWFGGTTKVPTYCVSAVPGFGKSEDEIAQAFERAFAKWTKYLETKHLRGHAVSGERGGDLPVATTITRHRMCDSSENLKIYAGTTSDTVERFKGGYDQPIAFSEKTAYDPEKGRGRGVMWLSPARKFSGRDLDWTRPGVLDGILLHEVGHIFGASHIAQTVMDAEMGYRVLGDRGPSTFAQNIPVAEIDSRSREVYACRTCTYVFEDTGHVELDHRFEKLVGRPPVGQVTARLATRSSSWNTVDGELDLMDSVGTAHFSIHAPRLIAHSDSVGVAFEVLAPEEEGNPGDHIPAAAGESVSGWLTSESGKKTPVVVNRNFEFLAEVVDLDGDVPDNALDTSNFFHGTSYTIR